MEIRSSTERWRSRILMATCCILALTAGIDAAVDRKRMDRDLDIMEAVLARLLNENGSSRELHDAIVQGIYFTGYGALFLVEGSGSWGAIPHRLRVISEGGHGKVDYTMGAAPRPADDEEDAKKRLYPDLSTS